MAEELSNEKKAGVADALKGLSYTAWIGIAVVALVIGILIGNFALGGGAGIGGGAGALGKATVSENELDTVVVNYTQNGATKSMTARDVISVTSSLDSAKDEEGNYEIPSADSILYAVRNKILEDEAAGRNINPTDEDLLSYAEEQLGQTPDFEAIATANGIDVDTVKALLTSSYRVSELQKQVGGEISVAEPEYPTEPEYATTNDAGEDLSSEEVEKNREEAYKKATPDYATYIIKLAGDEWDEKAGAWKSEDGEYATALADYDVTKDGATYEAAYAAYQVAQTKYSDAQTAYYDVIDDYYAELFDKCTITILTLNQ